MQKPLVFIVEDDESTKKILYRLLNMNAVNCMFALNMEEAFVIFEQNKKAITHIALDYRVPHSNGKCGDTSDLAKVIASDSGFHGEVFAMSQNPEDNDTLLWIMGKKCECLIDQCPSIKSDTIMEIVNRIKNKCECRLKR